LVADKQGGICGRRPQAGLYAVERRHTASEDKNTGRPDERRSRPADGRFF